MKENLKINPMIHAAVAVLSKVEGVDEVEILGDEMYRTEPCDECKAGCLGIDIKINEVKVFLRYAICEDLLMYPTGPFIAVDFVHEVLKDQNPKTFLKKE